jgi:hypothetical protein
MAVSNPQPSSRCRGRILGLREQRRGVLVVEACEMDTIKNGHVIHYLIRIRVQPQVQECLSLPTKSISGSTHYIGDLLTKEGYMVSR